MHALRIAPLALTLAACGSNPTFEVGVDGTRPVGQLTPGEARSVCEEAEATAEEFLEANKDGFCALTGAFTGAFGAIGGGGDPAALCESAREACEGSELMTETSTSSCNVTDDDIGDCAATVGEVSACYNDVISAYGAVFDDLASSSCAELVAESSSSPLDGLSEVPASCAALAAKCPELEIGLPEVDGDDD